MKSILSLCIAILVFSVRSLAADGMVLVEAESFAGKGGWLVDQQFVHEMGSPYLLAHGLGRPVAEAATTVSFPALGTYHVWVRTKNWVPGNWEAPGRFQLAVDGALLPAVFGTETGWGWQAGGTIEIKNRQTTLALKDLTGFDGRCDAICFSIGDTPPPNDPKPLQAWRDRQQGLPEIPAASGSYDVVVVGGGIAGCAAALAAERQGLKVALIHDRPVPGGNASSEVRVHVIGIVGKSGPILSGINTGHWPNGDALAIPDTEKRQRTLDAAKGIEQFLGWRAYAATVAGKLITSIDAKDIEKGTTRRFSAPVFIDCTGDGWIGYWAGAEFSYGRESSETFGESWAKHGELWSPKTPDNRVMGSSVLWNSRIAEQPVSFPAVPWAMAVAQDKVAVTGEWFWEYSANDKHQVDDAEAIRDHLLQAIYGSFANAKKLPKYANQELLWVAYVAGKRESRRLMGDYIYTQKDVVAGTSFPDTVAEEVRAVDVHYQVVEKNRALKCDFLSEAMFLKTPRYYIPFRCLYSRNIGNLMMAGRCFSCSHVGLGGPRVMNTTGQMGVATGYAAALCKKYGATPREIYQNHIKELRSLIGYAEK